jgi:hypothetical protein
MTSNFQRLWTAALEHMSTRELVQQIGFLRYSQAEVAATRAHLNTRK